MSECGVVSERALSSRMKSQVRRLALAGILVILSLCCFSCDNGDKEWEDAPGTKSKMNVGRWFEGTWSGGPWGELVLQSAGDDSVFGSADDGALSIAGRVLRYRIDMKVSTLENRKKERDAKTLCPKRVNLCNYSAKKAQR